MQEEKEIIELAKSGDRAALTDLVKLYEKTIYNFAFKICRDKDKAENIMQETFYSMIKSLHQFGGDSKLSTWLYRIVSNHCLMEARKLKDGMFVSLTETDDEENPIKEYAVDWETIPFKSTENDELKKILDDSIKKLHPDYRVVFLLRDVEGLSTEETGKVLELSVPAIKSRLHRARAFLRKELNEAFG